MNYFVPEGQNYIILESLNSIKENQYPLSIHVLMFIEENESFIIGRGHESDVRISDISVSRSHAKISLKNKKFYLEDTGSKFGTLVLAKDDLEINENQQILQIGRTLISIVELDLYKHLSKKLKKEPFGIGTETGVANFNENNQISIYTNLYLPNFADNNLNNSNDNLSNFNFQSFNHSIGKNNKSKDTHNKNFEIEPKFINKDFEEEEDDDI